MSALLRLACVRTASYSAKIAGFHEVDWLAQVSQSGTECFRVTALLAFLDRFLVRVKLSVVVFFCLTFSRDESKFLLGIQLPEIELLHC